MICHVAKLEEVSLLATLGIYKFYLGGFRRLSGLSPLELSGEHLLLGVLQAHYVLGERTTALSIAPFVSLTLEAGNVLLFVS
jgi:hypothetical protein